MADRRSSFNPFRIWSQTSAANRRTSSTLASAPPTGKTTSPRSSPAVERSSAGQTTAPRAETRPAGNSNIQPPNTNATGQSSTPTPPTPPPKTPSTAKIRPAENVNNPTLTNQSPSKTQSAGSANNANNQILTTPPTAETQSTGQINTPTSIANTNAAQSTTTPTPNPTTPSTAETQSTGQTNTPSSTANTNAPQSSTTPTPNPTTPSKAETQSAENANSLNPTKPSPSETQSSAENENSRTPTTPSSSGTQPPSQTNTTTTAPTNPHKDETQPAEKAITPSSTTPLTDETKTQTSGQSNTMPPSSEAQKANQPTLTSSPTRAIGQSRSPPKPSSPSRAALPSRATTSSPSRMSSVSQKASRSPNLTSSPSTKGIKPNITTPTKLRQKRKEISHPLSNSNGEASDSSASEKEPLEDQQRTNVKSDTVDVGDQQRTNVKPLIASNTKPEETKEVKEVIQETKRAANDQTNKKDSDFLTAKVDDAKSEQMKEETEGPLSQKETLPTSHFNGKLPRTNSQPENKSTSVPTHKAPTQSSGEQVPFSKEIRDDISTFVNRMAVGDPKSAPNDRPVSVITLAGENRGASMQLGSDSSKGEGVVPIHRGYKINPDKSPEETSNGDESLKNTNSRVTEGKEDQPTEAYVNNNTQGINNSIVFSSSLTERDPGVHMIVTRASPKEPTKQNDEKRHVEMQKAEVKMTPSEKLTYEPTVRRRCLRGLLMESSDSDPGNPEKPRRHGCRVGCNERSNTT